MSKRKILNNECFLKLFLVFTYNYLLIYDLNNKIVIIWIGCLLLSLFFAKQINIIFMFDMLYWCYITIYNIFYFYLIASNNILLVFNII